MSHSEFFAELYALYYDLNDPLRPNIPADITQWLNDKIGPPQPVAPAAPAADAEDAGPLPAWHWINRPK